jgi:hypothetical protein
MKAQVTLKCKHCDIMLEGRAQFMGHMIHGHETSLEEAEKEWKS